jgi:hypothetical protein
MKLLGSSFNPEASKIIRRIDQRRETTLNQASIALFSESMTHQIITEVGIIKSQ